MQQREICDQCSHSTTNNMLTSYLEDLVVEIDLTNKLLLAAPRHGRDSYPSDEGTTGVPGGVRSLSNIKAQEIIRVRVLELIIRKTDYYDNLLKLFCSTLKAFRF
ncbi:unnamed protein product [Fraxinus pennsylvanica]|uniref:Uncharacterized protein n=1 Tax=Fraxinus pennsylvanica TaxID=56036 RepID=A0AAD2E9H1_9LAMI|nr:unnamed protein product [Fraxinus pennsylvanica]